jgi:hypothetical protein
MHEATAELGNALSQATMSTVESTLRATPSIGLLHPGSARLLREPRLLP